LGSGGVDYQAISAPGRSASAGKSITATVVFQIHWGSATGGNFIGLRLPTNASTCRRICSRSLLFILAGDRQGCVNIA